MSSHRQSSKITQVRSIEDTVQAIIRNKINVESPIIATTIQAALRDGKTVLADRLVFYTVEDRVQKILADTEYRYPWSMILDTIKVVRSTGRAYEAGLLQAHYDAMFPSEEQKWFQAPC